VAIIQPEKPAVVILAAAKVGGIHANNNYPADFIYENLMIECNVIHQASDAGVRSRPSRWCKFPDGLRS
jgi:GDP-L-fucose synthase